MDTVKPRIAEYLLLAFVLLNVVANLYSFWNGEAFWSHNANYLDPYFQYNNNAGIKTIGLLTLILDITIASLLLSWHLFKKWTRLLVPTVLVLCVGASVLTWTELWYGSTFYYGEVRDKQALPVGVNNGGVVGSYVFLFYLLSRIRIRQFTEKNRKAYFLIGGFLLLVLHVVLWRLAYVPWNLWQS